MANKVILVGRLGQNPELTYTSSELAICKFTFCTNHKQKDKDTETSWHRIVAFGKTAETINQYVVKGQQLYIEGRISYGDYTLDGIKRYTTDIIVERFDFIGNNEAKTVPNDNPDYKPKEKFNSPGIDDDIPF